MKETKQLIRETVHSIQKKNNLIANRNANQSSSYINRTNNNDAIELATGKDQAYGKGGFAFKKKKKKLTGELQF